MGYSQGVEGRITERSKEELREGGVVEEWITSRSLVSLYLLRDAPADLGALPVASLEDCEPPVVKRVNQI